jgi:hypothetical protein
LKDLLLDSWSVNLFLLWSCPPACVWLLFPFISYACRSYLSEEYVSFLGVMPDITCLSLDASTPTLFLVPHFELVASAYWRDSRVSQVFYLISSHCCHWILGFRVFPFSWCLFSKKPKTYIFCWLYHISNNILNILYLYISICWLWQLVEFTMIISLSIPCFILSLDILWLHCEYLLSFFSMHSARQL